MQTLIKTATLTFFLLCLYTQTVLAQRIGYCDWQYVLDQSLDRFEELEQNIQSLGSETISFDEKLDIVSKSGKLFHGKSNVRSDIERDQIKKVIVRGQRLDKPGDYLKKVDLYYKTIDVRYEDPKITHLYLGNVAKSAEVGYEFNRVLEAKDDNNNPYQDVVTRTVVFRIKSAGGEFEPFISLMDYEKSEFNEQEALRRLREVESGCQSQLSQELAEAKAKEEEELRRQQAEAEAEKKRIRQEAEAEEARRQAEIRELEEQKQAEEEARLAELRKEQEEAEAEKQRRLAALEEQQRIDQEAGERQIRELERKQAIEQRRLRIRARRKRLFAPTLYLGVYALNQNVVQISGKTGNSLSAALTTIGGGFDVAYLKGEFSLMLESEALENRSLVENGFPDSEFSSADSVSVMTGSLVAGLPLMLGKNFVLFAGGGGMASNFAFKDAENDEAGSFWQVAPIAQASLTYMLPERGGGVTLSYRKSYNAKYSDFSGFGIAFHFYPSDTR